MGGLQMLSYVFLIFFLLGLLNIHFSDREDKCIMTYMFEYPQFVRIPVPENVIYPQYSLYAYSEGRLTEKVRKMWFDGIPVLFLPGNAGSYKQARSLASVALQKAMNKAYNYDTHFDYFTVSYNSELSGFYGGVLFHQTNFTAACITKILSLYNKNNVHKMPKTVILIGHSMGGVIAKRLLALPSTLYTTSIAITLSSPLEAPPVNTDWVMNSYYWSIESDWKENIRGTPAIKVPKILLSFGGGQRDVQVPSGLTSSNDSFISALTTAIPGVWVSTDHLSIVWCKQLMFVINRYLFGIVDPATEQISGNKQLLKSKALQYFQANRSMTLAPSMNRPVAKMIADAFWYEDNRRIYQITRPEIHKTVYLMIRLVSQVTNQFVAIEAINVEDKDWIFGCNAKHIHGSHRFCDKATSLTELSRWTGVANPQAGKRKLATIDLQDVRINNPDWSHVVVRVSPTRKNVTLNVDITNLSYRQVTVTPRYLMAFSKQVVVESTTPESLYYEITIQGFDTVTDAYLLSVEPTRECSKYHVSAELQVPWAKNYEYYHYFTQAKRSPMKLTLFKTNPNVTLGLEPTEFAKVIVILDPKCGEYRISISASWYDSLAQFCRHYSVYLIPYSAAIILLASRSNIVHLMRHGTCISTHAALSKVGVRPHYVLLYAWICASLITSVPMLWCACEPVRHSPEARRFVRSLSVLPVYMAAVGLTSVAAAAVLAVMVFSSQIAHRLLFRIMWRGGSGLAEKVAGALQKVPAVVSVSLVCAAQPCGAAALAAGAAFYGFMISKMYEEYLEDYFYKLLAKVSARTWKFITSKRRRNEQSKSLALASMKAETEKRSENLKCIENTDGEVKPTEPLQPQNRIENINENNDMTQNENNVTQNENNVTQNENETNANENIDENLSNLNFHMMLFLMWATVTAVNFPALLIWARNFKYSMVLTPDTSYPAGLVLSVCSFVVWQRDGPRKNLKHYNYTAGVLFSIATLFIVLGPFTLMIVNYGVTFMFLIITVQQVFDSEGKPALDDNAMVPKSDDSTDVIKDSNNVPGEKEDSNNAPKKRDSKNPSEKENSDNVLTEKTDKENVSSGNKTETSGENESSDNMEPMSSRQNKSEEIPDDHERIRRKHSFIADDFGAI